MYCSSCGAAVAQGLSFCNYCGVKFGGAEDDRVVDSTEVKAGLVVSAMVGLFILGLVAIAVLVGVLKAVAGFDFPILLAVTMLSFMLMVLVEAVLVGLLFKGRRRAKGAGRVERLKEQTTQELGEAQPRVLPEPVPSVIENTTRLFEPAYGERKSK